MNTALVYSFTFDSNSRGVWRVVIIGFTGGSIRCSNGSNALPAIVVSLCLLSELLNSKDPARNAACGLLPVLICRSQAGSSELEQSEYAFSHLLLALTCCAALSPLHFVGFCAGLLTRPREQPGLAVRALRLLAFVRVCARALVWIADCAPRLRVVDAVH
ncbi:hypothetical protein MRX96_041489 [Rhipicephalus microplus]